MLSSAESSERSLTGSEGSQAAAPSVSTGNGISRIVPKGSAMDFTSSLLKVAHLVGFALALGCGTVKLVLLMRTIADRDFVPTFLRVSKPVTRVLVLGLVFLAVSGLGSILLGYPITVLLVTKLALVAAIFVLGPVIDKAVEPKYRKLVPTPGEPSSPEFLQLQRRFVVLEFTANLLFYAIALFWLLRQHY
jgi:hypothetical protein